MIHQDGTVFLEEYTDIAEGVLKLLCGLGIRFVNLLHSTVHVSRIVRHKMDHKRLMVRLYATIRPALCACLVLV